MNTFRKPDPEVAAKKSNTRSSKKINFFKLFDPENYLNQAWWAKNLTFLLFLLALVVLYIYNSHLAERQARSISQLEKDIKELRWQYTVTKSELMFQSKQSEVAKKLNPDGLEELVQVPEKIKVKAAEAK